MTTAAAAATMRCDYAMSRGDWNVTTHTHTQHLCNVCITYQRGYNESEQPVSQALHTDCVDEHKLTNASDLAHHPSQHNYYVAHNVCARSATAVRLIHPPSKHIHINTNK